MKYGIKSFLKNYLPSFYKLGRWFYWVFPSFLFYPKGTISEEKKWGSRGYNEIKKDFLSLYHPHRQFLLEKLNTSHPFSNILEIGCGFGPNLYFISKMFPGCQLTGIDINPRTIQAGKKWLEDEGISNIKLIVGKADELIAGFANKSFDVVFTDSLLMYIGPDKIEKMVEGMIRLARRRLFLIEWHLENGSPALELGSYYYGHWLRDYRAFLKRFVKEDRVNILEFPNGIWQEKSWQSFGRFIEVTLL